MTTTAVTTARITRSPNGVWYLDEPAPSDVELLKHAQLAVAEMNYLQTGPSDAAASECSADDSPEWRAATAEELEKQRLFDETRPPCPKGWCVGDCETNGHVGDAIIHNSEDVNVASVSDRPGAPTGSVRIHAWRYDALTEPTESGIEIDLTNAGRVFGECADFTAAQARRFAAEMLRHADLIDPEPEVPAAEVRVGDWLPVDDEWLYVYGVCVDEPSNMVQIYVTVTRGEWPELDGDEDPHRFAPTDLVRVRRGGAR